MRAVIFVALFALVAARPDKPRPSYRPTYEASSNSVEVEKDERVYPSAAGEYSLDLALDDGTSIYESGYGSGPDGAVETQGKVQFVFPDGTPYELTYVANAEGAYQPESDFLPVAPEFPHPIPDFVLEQIAKAAREDAEGRDSSEEYGRYQ